MSPPTRAGRGPLWSDTGSISVEAAVLVPVVLFVGLLIVAGARVSSAQQAVDNAASAAARAASIARSPAAAQHAGTLVARERLGREGMSCDEFSVSVDASQIALGRPGQVRAIVECRVALSDLGLPVPEGTRTITSSFTSFADPYRGIP
ncbi:pilus assembly protein [Amycolatopsis rubida]|uniref:Pilus assembly protein n=1 Tax=Amycolatopsis rubida TaxID=112413 RepID=A0ABX0BUY1_9PSEU|nr:MULTISPECIES: TadE family protein [Amycolatopsis]MYW91667.1 pilus assembly protein [Amycolatopsis rubida]NEC56651.1 pilus assembly protein [Amycolatopsis rubida]OAP24438.1 TadE-like protein [Amycolatopsis sp. M39]